MNLRAIVNSAVQVINPDIIGVVRVSTGYTTNDNFEQVPQYADFPIRMQMQAISGGKGADGPEIEHVDSLNIQGTKRAFWLNGNVEGLDRPAGRGGDLLIVPATVLFPAATFLVTQVVEAWDSGGWVHVIGTLQMDRN